MVQTERAREEYCFCKTMKTLILTAIFCVSCVIGHAATPKAEDWVTPDLKIPNNITQKDNQVAEDHFYECQITKLGTALDRLKDVSYIELTDGLASYYAGHAYRPLKDHKAYLVRGAFANYTGNFTLFYQGGSLVIQHMSLGRSATPQFCPLIVQLPTPPKKVYIQIGGGL
jgi:hypothetical protein